MSSCNDGEIDRHADQFKAPEGERGGVSRTDRESNNGRALTDPTRSHLEDGEEPRVVHPDAALQHGQHLLDRREVAVVAV